MKQDAIHIQNQESKIARWSLLIGILFISSNLRVPLTSVGSLLSQIRDDLGINHTIAGSLTTIPLLAFFLVSPFVYVVAKRLGMEWTIFYSFLLLIIGLIVRTLSDVVLLMSGTALIGVAITFGNVLLPGLIKLKFPSHIGLYTGLYAVCMYILGALAAGVSVPLSRMSEWGWRGSLLAWTMLSIIALLCWIPQLRNKTGIRKGKDAGPTVQNNVWKSPLAWNITLYMGIQSMVFFTMVSWLPDILKSFGYPSDVAGWMLSLLQMAFVPFTFITPLIAEKLKDQRLLSAIIGVIIIFGVGGLLVGNPIIIALAIICIGGACGAAFSLCMMFFSLRTNDGQETAQMSGMAQSIGYFIAAVGPILLGFIHDITNSWSLPIIILGVASIFLIITGIKSGTNKKIEVPKTA
ncbi:CynX/NimT family MFS transporter [Alteribacillus iranensis]|uniref:MFS transporter, CP family, cyanate transporter n=1 Tax=Alteribacillus iranensis TaxID=930128 RepID=A0A1I2BCH8_9BACI|nr:MFS transporter [Alteribacillus iranensis]SFE53864.1 MFS transporter, CP family, cyanate transporter [Alteribacillus iranensis]